MGMMRRRPSGVSPSSWAGASVISALSRGCSCSIAEEAEDFALRAGRLAFLQLLAGVAQQRTQGLQIRRGKRRRVFGERGVVGEQALAPRLEAPVLGAGGRGAALHRRAPLA